MPDHRPRLGPLELGGGPAAPLVGVGLDLTVVGGDHHLDPLEEIGSALVVVDQRHDHVETLGVEPYQLTLDLLIAGEADRGIVEIQGEPGAARSCKGPRSHRTGQEVRRPLTTAERSVDEERQLVPGFICPAARHLEV